MAGDAASRATGPNRREFVLAGAAAAGFASFASVNKLFAASADAMPKAKTPILKRGQTILFQGDSITDVKRDRKDDKPNSPAALGSGYAWFAASQMLVDSPDAGYKIFNRGISGNKVYQLAERWQADCLDLKPDVLSILIGVNDFWHTTKHTYNGTLEIYEADYRKLLKRTKEALPDVKLVICEPFALKTGSVDASWFPTFDGYRGAAKKVAEDNGAVFVPFQSMFDQAQTLAPAATWAADGVHPTPSGAALMADWWLRAVGA